MYKNFLSIKRLFVLILAMVAMLSIISSASASAELLNSPISVTSSTQPATYTGKALYLALANIVVYDEEKFDSYIYQQTGTIFQNETFTVLSDLIRRPSSSGNNAPKISIYVKVQYSSSREQSGYKIGYINLGTNCKILGTAYLGKVTVPSTVWYGPSISRYMTIGSVSVDEYVVILDREYDWLYIEYDSAAGRKRGYIPKQNLYYKCDVDSLPIAWTGRVPYVTDYYDVYSGPTKMYARVGSINTEYVNLFDIGSINGQTWWRIGYVTPSGEKYGYIFPTKEYSD